MEASFNSRYYMRQPMNDSESEPENLSRDDKSEEKEGVKDNLASNNGSIHELKLDNLS